jgi:hypothetical protein
VKQSRNLTRHVKELESLYMDIVNESQDVETFEHEKNVKKGEVKGTPPDKAEGIETPAEESSKESTNTVKMDSNTINTSMNEKNIFDKLYSTIMEGDDDFDMSELDAGLDGGEDEFAGDEGGEEVTITLTPDQVDVLKDVLGQLEPGDPGDDIEDLDGGEGGGDLLDGGLEDGANPYPEAVEAKQTGEGQQPGQDPTQLGPNKKNVVAGTASKVTSGGASSDVTDKVGNDGNLADTTAKMTATGSRSNVVSGKITGGNQGLLA